MRQGAFKQGEGDSRGGYRTGHLKALSIPHSKAKAKPEVVVVAVKAREPIIRVQEVWE